jgi:hypothetical protein
MLSQPGSSECEFISTQTEMLRPVPNAVWAMLNKGPPQPTTYFNYLQENQASLGKGGLCGVTVKQLCAQPPPRC